MDDVPMFEEELFGRMYDVAFQEMEESFKDPGVYMALLATFGKEKADWFLDMWDRI